MNIHKVIHRTTSEFKNLDVRKIYNHIIIQSILSNSNLESAIPAFPPKLPLPISIVTRCSLLIILNELLRVKVLEPKTMDLKELQSTISQYIIKSTFNMDFVIVVIEQIVAKQYTSHLSTNKVQFLHYITLKSSYGRRVIIFNNY